MTDSTPEGLFQISRTDGVISVMSAIDREVVGDIVNLTIKVPLYFSPLSLTNNVGVHL